MNPLLIILLIAAAAAIAFLIALIKIFDMAFAPKRTLSSRFRDIPDAPQYKEKAEQLTEYTDSLCSKPFEEMYVKSRDGLTLYGRYYKRSDENVVKIEFHGYRSHAFRDFCGGDRLNDLCKINSLLVDMRSHGRSEGNAITFGIKERYDVLCWVEKVIEEFGKDTKIILSGISMGAATVLMASELELPQNVRGIIADCPYSSPRDIIITVAGYRHLNGKLLFPLVKLSAKLFAKTDIDSASPIEAVKHTNIPILIVHGDDDRYVPYSMGKKIYEACASDYKRFLTVKDAGHGLAYLCDTPEYNKAAISFINSVI